MLERGGVEMCRSEGKGLDQGFSAEVFWWAMSRIIKCKCKILYDECCQWFML